MWETPVLVDTGILKLKGKHLSRIRSNGASLLFFQFDDLTEQEAFSILSSREAELIRAFYRGLRDLRKQMDVATGRGDGR